MKTALVALTPAGLELARRYRAEGPEGSTIHAPSSLVENPAETDLVAWEGPLRPVLAEIWRESDAIVAFMALGIVVRLLGPLAVDKSRDPAVVAVDEAGRFAIAVLGGHSGGANALASEVAAILGAQPVVTTASDASGLPAVDLIGNEDGWIIERPQNLTTVAAAVVRRQAIAVWQDAGRLDWWRAFGDWPAHFHRVRSIDEIGRWKPASLLWISDRVEPEGLPPIPTLTYRPPTLVAGIGCKRGTSRSTIEGWVDQVLAENHLAPNSLAAIATATLKVDEPGLIEFAGSRGLPLVAFPAGSLAKQPGIETPSPMVRSKIGIPAVAEPAALIASGAGRLLVPKRKGPGVTVALARRGTS